MLVFGPKVPWLLQVVFDMWLANITDIRSSTASKETIRSVSDGLCNAWCDSNITMIWKLLQLIESFKTEKGASSTMLNVCEWGRSFKMSIRCLVSAPRNLNYFNNEMPTLEISSLVSNFLVSGIPMIYWDSLGTSSVLHLTYQSVYFNKSSNCLIGWNTQWLLT